MAADMSRRNRDTSLRFHWVQRASGIWGCAQGIVWISMGLWSRGKVYYLGTRGLSRDSSATKFLK